MKKLLILILILITFSLCTKTGDCERRITTTFPGGAQIEEIVIFHDITEEECEGKCDGIEDSDSIECVTAWYR